MNLFDNPSSGGIKGRGHKLYYVGAGQTPQGRASVGAPLVAGRHYFRLWLTSIYLFDVKPEEPLFPCVFNVVGPTRAGQLDSLASVLSGEQLETGRNEGRIASANSFYAYRLYRPHLKLTPLTPFDGGPLVLDTCLALWDSRSEELDSASRLSADATADGLRVSLENADRLLAVINKGLGAADGHQTMRGAKVLWDKGGEPLHEGYLVLIDDDRREIDLNRLRVSDDHLLYERARGEVELLWKHSYVLLRVERRDEYDDWNSLTHIQTPYARAVKLFGLGQVSEALESYKEALAAAANAFELTSEVDRPRLVLQMEQGFERARENPAQFAFTEADASLDSVMQGAMSPAEAIARRISARTESTVEPEDEGSTSKLRDDKGDVGRGLESEESPGGEGSSGSGMFALRELLRLRYMPTVRWWSKPLLAERLAESIRGGESVPARPRFYMSLEGEGAKGDAVQYGAEVDLVFNYAVPPAYVLTLLSGSGLEAARAADAALQIAILPRRFIFRETDQEWLKEARFEDGVLVEPLRFHLRAAEESESGPAAEGEAGQGSAGFHVIISMRGVMLYEFSLRVRLVRKVADVEPAALTHALDLDLDKCARRAARAESVLAAALSEGAR